MTSIVYDYADIRSRMLGEDKPVRNPGTDLTFSGTGCIILSPINTGTLPVYGGNSQNIPIRELPDLTYYTSKWRTKSSDHPLLEHLAERGMVHIRNWNNE